MGYFVGITPQNTTAEIGWRTYQLDLPGPIDSTLADNGPGMIVVNKFNGSFQDIPPEQFKELRINESPVDNGVTATSATEQFKRFRIDESVDVYPYSQQSIVFYNLNRTIAGAVDLMFFKEEMPPFETLNRLLVIAYGINAATTADVSAALFNETFHGYPANIHKVNNPLNNRQGYLVQILADGSTVMNFLLDNETYNQRFQFWGA